ncbi:MAG: YicC family protein [Sphingobacteriia bacterium]|nr:YicC family protein [Sphingobacteriia bacterium]
MIKSMTGFGKATVETAQRIVTIEIRVLNSKQLDLNVRLPAFYREREHELRSSIGSLIQRGKTDCFINYESVGQAGSYSINQDMAEAYYSQLRDLSVKLGVNEPSDYLQIIMRLPEVMHTASNEVPDEEWIKVINGVSEAALAVDAFRIQEGAVLERDFKTRVTKILDLLKEVEVYEGLREQNIREKLRRELSQLTELRIDENRLEQELIYYLEKIDITEEKVRLRKHCDYFFNVLKEQDNQGRKLGFVAQEMGREINTLGSKANQADMQQLVVMMKDELEKIKEQLLNIL